MKYVSIFQWNLDPHMSSRQNTRVYALYSLDNMTNCIFFLLFIFVQVSCKYSTTLSVTIDDKVQFLFVKLEGHLESAVWYPYL